MMLTWKIFVTITCMVSLTLQMNPLNTESSSGSSLFTDPGSPWWKDPQSGRHYPHLHKIFNRFQPGSDAYNCYAFIRLYCGTQNDADATSDDCAKNGIFLYSSEREMTYYERLNNPHTWVYDFFSDFTLNKGELQLPEQFCLAKDIKCGVLYRSCMKVLNNYTAQVLFPYMTPEELADPGSQKAIRLEIAKYALTKRDLYIIQDEEKDNYYYEIEYLKHISEQITSNYDRQTPFHICKGEKNSSKTYEFSDLLSNHLQLNAEIKV